MRVLGIHDGHNAAAALVVDGRVVAAAQEERFRREKNWSGLPTHAIAWVLRYANMNVGDLDAVAMNGYHMPYPKDRQALLEEYRTTGTLPMRVRRIARNSPLRAAHRARRRRERLGEVVALGVPADRVQFVEHHTAHAAAAYYGFGRYNEPVLVLTNDGSGDGLCASVRVGRGGTLGPRWPPFPRATPSAISTRWSLS